MRGAHPEQNDNAREYGQSSGTGLNEEARYAMDRS